MRRDGSQFAATESISMLRDDEGRVIGTVLMIADITERRQLEEQLRGAQRMEAIGRLAGGIAHDFNNLLTAMTYSTQLLAESLPPDDARQENVEEIQHATGRAASLTQQLLAFGRRQVLIPRMLNLNDAVTDVERMLTRLIGEDVELATVCGPDLGMVKADLGQLEQVLVNLAVNARDAMPKGGVLLIETANITFDRSYAERHPVVVPGDYVMVAVTDTGTGIDEETQAHIFEPFFTTKEPGKGTGLGLATVYGIVKQSGGFIWVYSEPRFGTTFKIYLPRVTGELPTQRRATPVASVSLQGTETVLLVEDEELLRRLMRRMLERQGYKILEARHGNDALRLCDEYQGDIDVLVTDVVMPEMGGRELAESLKKVRPGTQVIFMSGYTGVDAVRRGFLEPDAAFLQKPLSPETLTRKIREVLDPGGAS
jgi:signal transduction histidine kinase